MPRNPAVETEELSRLLREVAANLWWAWHEEGWSLFQTLDPAEWRATNHNPIATLARASRARMDALAQDPIFVKRTYDALAARQAYMEERAWFQRGAAARLRGLRIAYFCSEYALHESMQQYSGGLGVLAGDHLKSASDLGIPLCGVGLLYRHGYYVQQMARDGRTMVLYPTYDFSQWPIEDLGVSFACPVGERRVKVRVWRMSVGRVPLYLLDTDLKANAPEDRELTEGLYKGEPLLRLRQQVLLGVGGMLALHAVGERPTVIHLNEGHAAFAALQRVADLVRAGSPATEAIDAVRRTTVFTTHTPVPAGHDRYDPETVAAQLRAVARTAKIAPEELLALGRELPANDREPFCMTVLALRLSGRANGVSQLHGEVSRQMWTAMYGGDASRVPIGSITNGVHPGTWIDPEAERFWRSEIGLRLDKQAPTMPAWARAPRTDHGRFWQMRHRFRSRLIHFIRDRLALQAKRRGEGQGAVAAAYSALDDDALTICFARRFATYKRAPLIFHDPDRLAHILCNARRPVQLVFAGKAHPRDEPGQAYAQRIHRFARDPRFGGRVAFIEEYDMHVGRMLTSGCDVWLNTPLRPYEASGTSGMKPPMHGGVNVSILDGWWPEACDHGTNGWAIGSVQQHQDQDAQDDADAHALYHLLEREVVPAFYQHDADGLPRRWIEIALASTATVPPTFSSHRMVAQYARQMYVPAYRDRGT